MVNRYFYLIVILFTFSYSKAQLLYTFDGIDISEWILEGDGEIFHDDDSGLPGGCIRFDDPATGIISVMTTPAAFYGAWNDASQNVSMDFFIETSDFDIIETFEWVIEISGPGGVAHALTAYLPVLNEWINLDVPVEEASWTIISGTWDSILQNVNQMRIRIEYITGVENVYFDNIALSFTPEKNELNGDVCSSFETYGFDGWTFENTGALTYTEVDGNPTGAISIGDASSLIGLGFAPYKFLGDWNVLGESATFSFDLRINSGSPIFEEKEFMVKIVSGAGEAIIVPDYIEIEEARDTWKNFTYPVDPAAWMVTSGTWEGIIADVDQIIFELEYISGTETILLDNICLFTDNIISSIENEHASGVISVNPVPTTDIIYITNADVDVQSGMITIYNINGQAMINSQVQFYNGIVSMDISELAPGLYLLQLKEGNSGKQLKFVVE